MELLKGVIGSAAARTVSARQTDAASAAVRITWRSEVDRMPCL
jgi:hypothetical protein